MAKLSTAQPESGASPLDPKLFAEATELTAAVERVSRAARQSAVQSLQSLLDLLKRAVPNPMQLRGQPKLLPLDKAPNGIHIRGQFAERALCLRPSKALRWAQVKDGEFTWTAVSLAEFSDDAAASIDIAMGILRALRLHLKQSRADLAQLTRAKRAYDLLGYAVDVIRVSLDEGISAEAAQALCARTVEPDFQRAMDAAKAVDDATVAKLIRDQAAALRGGGSEE